MNFIDNAPYGYLSQLLLGWFQMTLYTLLLCIARFWRRGAGSSRNNGSKTGTRVGKCGPVSAILSIPLPKEGVQQLRPGDTTTNTIGVWGWTETTKINGNILVAKKCIHSP